jgi:hypothetical protein
MPQDVKEGDFIIEKQPDGTYNVMEADWKIRRNVPSLELARQVAIGNIDGGTILYRHHADIAGHVEPL